MYDDNIFVIHVHLLVENIPDRWRALFRIVIVLKITLQFEIAKQYFDG